MSVITLKISYFTNLNMDNNIIIDVRGDDYSGGNIPSSINIKSTNYNDILSYIKKYDKPYDKIIIYCMYCMVRSVGVANRLTKDLQNKNIYLIDGGFSKYFNYYIKNNPEKIENLDINKWKIKNNIYKHIYD